MKKLVLASIVTTLLITTSSAQALLIFAASWFENHDAHKPKNSDSGMMIEIALALPTAAKGCSIGLPWACALGLVFKSESGWTQLQLNQSQLMAEGMSNDLATQILQGQAEVLKNLNKVGSTLAYAPEHPQSKNEIVAEITGVASDDPNSAPVAGVSEYAQYMGDKFGASAE